MFENIQNILINKLHNFDICNRRVDLCSWDLLNYRARTSMARVTNKERITNHNFTIKYIQYIGFQTNMFSNGMTYRYNGS